MKYYGIFRFTARTWQHKEHLLASIYYNFIKGEKNEDFKALNKDQLARSRYDENLKGILTSWREWYKYDRQTSRCQTFSTKFMIHECDEHGVWIPTKKELKDAEAFVSGR